MTNETPNPCPWCGGSTRVTGATPNGPRYVECRRKGCSTYGPTAKNRAEAIAAWNRVAKVGQAQSSGGIGCPECVAIETFLAERDGLEDGETPLHVKVEALVIGLQQMILHLTRLNTERLKEQTAPRGQGDVS